MRTGPYGFWAAAALLNFFLLGCAPSSQTSNPSQESQRVAEPQHMKGVMVQSFSGDKPLWRLRTQEAITEGSGGPLTMPEFSIEFFKGGALSSTLTATQGWVHPETQAMKAWDNVVIVSSDGIHVTTDFLEYLPKDQLIVSTAPVRVRQGTTLTTGVGFRATPNLSQITILNQQVELER